MKSKYDLVEVKWTRAGFPISILKIKEEDINDKLALLSNGSGVLSEVEHQDFLVRHCLADTEKVISFFSKSNLPNEELELATEELIKLIVRVNPMLDPTFLIINNNNVIKVPSPGDLEDRRLIDNPGWKNGFIADEDSAAMQALLNSPTIAPGGGFGFEPDDVDNINAEAHVWDDIGSVVYIKKLSKLEGYNLLAKTLPDKSIDNDKKYKAIVVAKYVVNYGNILLVVDSRVPSTLAMVNKLYEFCVETNPYLRYEDIDKNKLHTLKKRIEGSKGRQATRPIRKGDASTEAERESILTSIEDVEENLILKLADTVKKRVIGQDDIVDSIVESIQIARSGLKEEVTPIGAYLLCGRTGTGKTHTARIISEELCNAEHPIRIDCSEYTQPHDVVKLTGCFLPDTKITMADGTLKEISAVKKGDMVLSHKGRSKRVLNTFKYDYSGDIISVRVGNDPYTIRCTPGHEIMANSSYKSTKKGIDVATWTEAKSLLKGDIVYMSVISDPKITSPTLFLDLEDGSEECFKTLDVDERLCEDIGRYLTGKKMVCLKGLTEKHMEDILDGFSYLIADEPSAIRLPDWWVLLPNSLILAFLSGVFAETDDNEEIFEVSSFDEDFIAIVRTCINKFGVVGKLHRDLAGFKHTLSLSEKEYYILKSSRLAPASSEVRAIPREITETGHFNYTGPIYDLQVEEDTSYQVRGVAVHNSPPSYVGYNDGGALTNKIRANPFSVVLFDEIEKGHTKLHDMLLQIMDEGRLTSGKGETVSFGNALILMTSNVGVKNVDNIESTMGFGDVAKITDNKKNKAIVESVKSKFKPEFINRLDGVLVFSQLNEEACRTIIKLNVDEIGGWLKEKEVDLELTPAAISMILKNGFSEAYGARPMKRYIRQHIVKPLALKILKKEINTKSKVVIKQKDGKLLIQNH